MAIDHNLDARPDSRIRSPILIYFRELLGFFVMPHCFFSLAIGFIDLSPTLQEITAAPTISIPQVSQAIAR